MHINRLNINAVRNISVAQLRDLRRINVLYGANGSGKTSALEALYLLCMGRSFRSHRARTVIQTGQEAVTVYGELGKAADKKSIGVRKSLQGATEVKINGKPISSLAELASLLPVQLFDAKAFQLIDGPPAQRRQFMDWGVFHVEHGFNAHWQAMKKCIKQRNSLLRHGKIDLQSLASWDQKLAVHGVAVDAYRSTYVTEIKEEIILRAERLVAQGSIDIEYRRGWQEAVSLAEALVQSRDRDQALAHTSVGPHRAELSIKVDGRAAADVLSRGQQKSLVCAMRLAQASHLERRRDKACLFLLDDIGAEMDFERRRRLCRELEVLKGQVFVTCIDPSELAGVWGEDVRPAMFHVEHGELKADIREQCAS